ncbi:ArsR/SmtB family transcription factor [Ilumatobacter sp.]|uniref:ArsR/SmtB family transcription factor n=1 Tax=Ilumatobacter sp. TaxID=1967498 RepID=UPI003AF910C7
MDEVFRAIDDRGRRSLLDALFERDGQTLVELSAVLPDMSRQGVMNHLRVLESAGLVTTHKVGRRRFHHLNPVPIKLISDRWIGKYAAPRLDAIVAVRDRAEKGTTMERPVHIYQAYIRASVDDVWQAIVDPEQTVQYFYGTRVQSDWEVGSPMNYTNADGTELVSEGTVLSIDPPKRIEFTFRALWDDALAAEGPCREVWSVEEVNGMSRLTIELYDVVEDSATYTDFVQGFPYIVSGMKSLLETGAPLPAPY